MRAFEGRREGDVGVAGRNGREKYFPDKGSLIFYLSGPLIQHGRYLETWYLEAGRDLGITEADTEVGVL